MFKLIAESKDWDTFSKMRWSTLRLLKVRRGGQNWSLWQILYFKNQSSIEELTKAVSYLKE